MPIVLEHKRFWHKVRYLYIHIIYIHAQRNTYQSVSRSQKNLICTHIRSSVCILWSDPVHLVYNDEATSEVYLSAALRSASPSLVERRIRLPNVTSSGGTPLCKTLLLLDCQFCWQAEAVTRKSDAPVHIFFQEILVLPITAVVKLCHFPDHNGCFWQQNTYTYF